MISLKYSATNQSESILLNIVKGRIERDKTEEDNKKIHRKEKNRK